MEETGKVGKKQDIRSDVLSTLTGKKARCWLLPVVITASALARFVHLL